MSDFATIIRSPAEDVSVTKLSNKCNFAFTSPPYFRKEHYSEDETQSWKRYGKAEEWRDGFLFPMMRLQYAALKKGSFAVVNIADVLIGSTVHPLCKWTIEAARDAGFEEVERLEFPMSRRFGSNQEEGIAVEPVFVFKKA